MNAREKANLPEGAPPAPAEGKQELEALRETIAEMRSDVDARYEWTAKDIALDDYARRIEEIIGKVASNPVQPTAPPLGFERYLQQQRHLETARNIHEMLNSEACGFYEGGLKCLTCEEIAKYLGSRAAAPEGSTAPRPPNCICSEAYGVGPEKCPAHAGSLAPRTRYYLGDGTEIFPTGPILMAAPLLSVTSDVPSSDYCPKCNKLIMRPDRNYGINPEAVCKCAQAAGSTRQAHEWTASKNSDCCSCGWHCVPLSDWNQCKQQWQAHVAASTRQGTEGGK
jgi:hypothetical protein